MNDPKPDDLMAARLEDLKQAALKLQIEIRFDHFSDPDIPIESGFCKVHGQSVIVIDNRLPVHRQVEVILNLFQPFDWEDVYLPSWMRDRLDNPETIGLTP